MPGWASAEHCSSTDAALEKLELPTCSWLEFCRLFHVAYLVVCRGATACLHLLPSGQARCIEAVLLLQLGGDVDLTGDAIWRRSI